MYYNIEENKQIISSTQFRELFPNISFPKILTDEIMEEYGYKKVVINEVTPNQFTNVVNGEIEVIEGVPTIQQMLVYKSLEECREIKIEEIKNACTAYDPVTLEVDFIDGSVETITFNGGDSSASAIAGAATLAQNLGETNVSLWDLDNKVHNSIALSEAMKISAIIAKKWRDDMFKRQDLLTQINNPNITIEELEAIEI